MVEFVLLCRVETILGGNVEHLDQLVVMLVVWCGPIDDGRSTKLAREGLLGILFLELAGGRPEGRPS